jgi:hypothetical protein
MIVFGRRRLLRQLQRTQRRKIVELLRHPHASKRTFDRARHVLVRASAQSHDRVLVERK